MEEKNLPGTKKTPNETGDKGIAAKNSATEAKKPTTKSRLRSLELLYQPVFDIHLNMAIDFETSLRINDRQMGVLLDDVIYPVAEKSSQICELNKWNVEEACDAILRCAKREADINRVIVPISVKYLARKNMPQQLLKIVESKGVNSDKFCLNISESILEENKVQVAANIKELREHGFLVSIDDFGVEFTAMSRLGQYEVDYIGLDASLIEDIMTNERTQNMIQGIIDFVKKLESQVRVNGVDSEEKAKLLRSMGVDQMKGELYGGAIYERQIKL